MKPNHNFLSFSVFIIIIISFIIIGIFYYIKSSQKENFSNINNFEVLPSDWDVNKNADPKTNPSLLKYNRFKDIPNDLITRTPYTINKFGQQNYNAYFYKNNYIYPLY